MVEPFNVYVIPTDESPCVILKELEAVYRDAIQGKAAKRVRYRDDTGAEEEIDFGSGPDLKRLADEIARYRRLCAESLGLVTAPHQFAMRAR